MTKCTILRIVNSCQKCTFFYGKVHRIVILRGLHHIQTIDFSFCEHDGVNRTLIYEFGTKIKKLGKQNLKSGIFVRIGSQSKYFSAISSEKTAILSENSIHDI